MEPSSTTIDDLEVEDLDQVYLPKSLPPRPLGRRSEPKIIDWEPISPEKERGQGRFSRRKTAPSVENAPPYQRPVFSGRTISKSPMSVSINSLAENGKSEQKLVKTSSESLLQRQSSGKSSTFNPVELMQNNVTSFIYTTIPESYAPLIQCSLRRDREGIQKNLFPMFYLHAERPQDRKKFLLLAARKIPKVNRQVKYLISTNIETLSEKSGGNGYVGKLRGNNLFGTEYTMYDNGVNPTKFKSSLPNDRTGLRRELAAIVYNTNVFGFKGPRQVNVLVPQEDRDFQPTKSEKTMLDCWHDREFNSMIQLRNEPPHYNDASKSYTLEFKNGRVGPSSVKNFQLIMETQNHEEQVVMQFGRINDDTFTCDYRYPLSALQAFGIALSAFDSRLTRE